MIARMHGTLEAVTEDRALLLGGGGLVYEVLLPAFAVTRLQSAVGQQRMLHTLTFLESVSQGSSFIPRLAGFLSEEDKAFFELLVSVKGLGYRRGLKAMNMPPARIAAAIADRDVKLLQTMPTIGKKNAESLALDLKDKVDRFLTSVEAGPRQGNAEPVDVRSPSSAEAGNGQANAHVTPGRAREALEALVSLGENRAEAAQMVDRVLTGENAPEDSQGVINAVYRLKAGG